MHYLKKFSLYLRVLFVFLVVLFVIFCTNPFQTEGKKAK